MSKLARSDEPKVNQVQIKPQVQMTQKSLDIWSFVIDLKFACLPVGRDFDI
jgi:hypothetical protein